MVVRIRKVFAGIRTAQNSLGLITIFGDVRLA